NNGDANVAFWFLQDNSFKLNTDGTFSGQHVNGDVLIQSAFTNGGLSPPRWLLSGTTGVLRRCRPVWSARRPPRRSARSTTPEPQPSPHRGRIRLRVAPRTRSRRTASSRVASTSTRRSTAHPRASRTS